MVYLAPDDDFGKSGVAFRPSKFLSQKYHKLKIKYFHCKEKIKNKFYWGSKDARAEQLRLLLIFQDCLASCKDFDEFFT